MKDQQSCESVTIISLNQTILTTLNHLLQSNDKHTCTLLLP